MDERLACRILRLTETGHTQQLSHLETTTFFTKSQTNHGGQGGEARGEEVQPEEGDQEEVHEEEGFQEEEVSVSSD